jgi:hypothetical protein
MNTYRVVKPVVIFCLAFALIGCTGDGLKRALGDPPKEIFDAQTIEHVPSGRLVTIVNELPGDIQVIAYPDDPATPDNEITMDYARTGWDEKSEEKAAAEAEQHIAVTMQDEPSGIEIHVTAQNVNPSDTVVLHVRVPPRTPLKITSVHGNCVIMGEFNYVEAQTAGNIEVRGAVGKLALKTTAGNIVVDEVGQQPDQSGRLDLETGKGNISIYAVGVNIKATASNGDIRFIGSLMANRESYFETKGKGNIVLALPDDVSYTFDAIGGNKVVNDFAPSSIVCGKAPPTAALDYHAEPIPGQVGHVDVTYQSTTTHRIRGTMMAQNHYYLLYLTDGKVAKYIPTSASVQQAGGALWTAECEKIDTTVTSPVKFQAQAAAGGSISVRLISKHAN